MSFRKVTTVAAAAAATIALSTVAYASNGQGPPGPAGNPNQPAGQPQANAPQGPQGNGSNSAAAKAKANSHGKSAAAKSKSHGNSAAAHAKTKSRGRSVQAHAKAHGKSQAQHGKSGESHPAAPKRNSNSNTNNGHAGKVTICHATRSLTHPYVEITISANGQNGHGFPNEVSRHHDSEKGGLVWRDINPAPAQGCPTTVQPSQPQGQQNTTPPQTAPSAQPSGNGPQSLVLGERVSGKAKPGSKAKGKGPQSMVLGAQASGRAPAAARAARATNARGLPFTGTQLAFVLICAAVALMGGIALRRALSSQ